MKNNNLQTTDISVGHTVIKLALVSGGLITSMYGVLLVCASAFKVLG